MRKTLVVNMRRRYFGFGAALAAVVCLLSGSLSSIAGAESASVIDIRVWSNPQSARVVVHLDGAAKFAHDRLRSPSRIFVDIQGVTLNLRDVEKMRIRGGGVLKGVRIGRRAPLTPRIVLDLKQFQSYKVFSLTAPDRIVIDINARRRKRPVRGAGVRTTTAVPSLKPLPASSLSSAATLKRIRPATPRRSGGIPRRLSGVPARDAPRTLKKEAPAGPEEMSLAERFRRGLGKIVIDPGHGGRDPGAIGHSGIYEKHVVLDIAKRMARSLRGKLRAKVFLTRRGDRFVSLKRRTIFANRKKADLFISVHANSAQNRRLGGIETYLLSEATDERAKKVAARENNIPVEDLDDLQIILADLRMRGLSYGSFPLAESIHQAILSNLSRRYRGIRNLGVKRAPFYVLLGAEMPSVLVEVGFLTNRAGERRLRSGRYRQALAVSMVRGVRKFIRRKRLAQVN